MRSALLHLLILALMVMGPAALATPVRGGQYDADASGTDVGQAVGPSAPEVAWVTATGDTAVSYPGQLLLDDAGHVLVPYSEEGQGFLLALDAATGEEAWRARGVQPYCAPAVGEHIYAQVVPPDGPGPYGDLVAIDPADGSLVDGYLFDGGDTRLGTCQRGLRLADDGTLVLLEQGDLRAISTDGGFTELWHRERTVGQRSLAPGPVLSADQGSIYTLDPGEGDGPDVLQSYAVGDGEPLARTPVRGTGLPTSDFLADADGPIVRSVDESAGYVTAYDDAGGSLAERWSLASNREGDATANRFALIGDRLILPNPLSGLDRRTGETQWSTSLQSANGLVRLDADGNTYSTASVLGGPWLYSTTPAGETRFVHDEPPEGLSDITSLSVTDADGAMYAQVLLEDEDPGLEYAVIRIDQGGAGGAPPQGEPYVPPEGTSRVAEDAVAEPVPLGATLCRLVIGEPDTARSVLVARDDEFADALAGAPLASSDSCILFTPGGPDEPLDPETRAELDRVLADGGLVRILGGAQAVSQQVADELASAGYAVERLAGATRFQTAIEIARRVVTETPVVPGYDFAVMVAYGYDWPDAVTGGAFGAWAGVPVLLTGTDQLHPDTAAALEELDRGSTQVLGGQAVVSDAVVRQLRDRDQVVQRFAGANRMGTAVQVAEQLWGSGEPERNLERFTMVNLGRYGPGSGFAGWTAALAAAPLSAQLRAPQLGVYTDAYPQATEQFLSRFAGGELPAVVLTGGVQVIDTGVEDGIRTTVGG